MDAAAFPSPSGSRPQESVPACFLGSRPTSNSLDYETAFVPLPDRTQKPVNGIGRTDLPPIDFRCVGLRTQ